MYARDHRLAARNALAGKWGISILVCLLAVLLGGVLVSNNFEVKYQKELDPWQLISPEIVRLLMSVASINSTLALLQFILGGPVSLGYSNFLLKQHDGQEGEVKDLFSYFTYFAQAFLMQLLRNLFIFLWTLLFIIPGIVASFSYAMAPFIMAENPELTGMEALRRSKELMYGYRWRLFCLNCSFIGWSILSTLTLGIGSLWLNPYMNQAYASFYRNLLQEKGEAQRPNSSYSFEQ